MKKTLMIVFSYSIAAITIYGQSLMNNGGIPSPSVTSLGMINEIPVSLYTGRCDITIPVYEFVEGDITVPVYLSYNSSGVMPDVHPGWVGMNWALQAGGVITRIVKGWPDELDTSRKIEEPKINYSMDNHGGYMHV